MMFGLFKKRRAARNAIDVALSELGGDNPRGRYYARKAVEYAARAEAEPAGSHRDYLDTMAKGALARAKSGT